ncbi:hypothetical protein RC94_06270 [Pectobacterium brasiliense]|nr:hypothetical protein RC79_19600 [Pectobacterium brasiliense]KHT06907.1 hypothetical protein RC92_11670 [Pectobacterium brasiliense]KHT12286.1 hypothetical protein RC94_06270 [Pectobacterium brasiliense]
MILPSKEHTSEFPNEALKLVKRIGIAAVTRKSELAAENSCIKSQVRGWDEELVSLQKAEAYFDKLLK